MKKEQKLTPINKSIKMMSEFKDKVKEKYPRETLVVQAIDHCIEFANECKIAEFNAMFDAWITARFEKPPLDTTFRQYYEEKFKDYANTRTNEPINE